MKYLVVVEESASGFSAYLPDVPGCIATGNSRSDVERRIAQAIAFHIEGMRTEGLGVPEPHSFSAYVEVPA
jgi:predicted RNase H-like HicB family nuclease